MRNEIKKAIGVAGSPGLEKIQFGVSPGGHLDGLRWPDKSTKVPVPRTPGKLYRVKSRLGELAVEKDQDGTVRAFAIYKKYPFKKHTGGLQRKPWFENKLSILKNHPIGWKRLAAPGFEMRLGDLAYKSSKAAFAAMGGRFSSDTTFKTWARSLPVAVVQVLERQIVSAAAELGERLDLAVSEVPQDPEAAGKALTSIYIVRDDLESALQVLLARKDPEDARLAVVELDGLDRLAIEDRTALDMAMIDEHADSPQLDAASVSDAGCWWAPLDPEPEMIKPRRANAKELKKPKTNPARLAAKLLK